MPRPPKNKAPEPAVMPMPALPQPLPMPLPPSISAMPALPPLPAMVPHRVIDVDNFVRVRDSVSKLHFVPTCTLYLRFRPFPFVLLPRPSELDRDIVACTGIIVIVPVSPRASKPHRNYLRDRPVSFNLSYLNAHCGYATSHSAPASKWKKWMKSAPPPITGLALIYHLDFFLFFAPSSGRFPLRRNRHC